MILTLSRERSESDNQEDEHDRRRERKKGLIFKHCLVIRDSPSFWVDANIQTVKGLQPYYLYTYSFVGSKASTSAEDRNKTDEDDENFDEYLEGMFPWYCLLVLDECIDVSRCSVYTTMYLVLLQPTFPLS